MSFPLAICGRVSTPTDARASDPTAIANRFFSRHAEAAKLFEAACDLYRSGYFAEDEPSFYRSSLVEYYADIGELERSRQCRDEGLAMSARWLAWRQSLQERAARLGFMHVR